MPDLETDKLQQDISREERYWLNQHRLPQDLETMQRRKVAEESVQLLPQGYKPPLCP